MHAREVVVRFFGVAGVIEHLLADMLRQMAHLVVGRAARSGGTSACRSFACFVIDDG